MSEQPPDPQPPEVPDEVEHHEGDLHLTGHGNAATDTQES